MPTEFDDSEFPLVRLHAHGQSTDAEVAERIAFLERQAERGEPFALVFDTTGSKPLTASQRKMYTDWLEQHTERAAREILGCAFVVTSALNRGIFTGVFWVWKPPMPYTFCGSRAEAEVWARARLAGAPSVPLPG